ncbi:MAG: TIGR03086 family metal-binding protein [Ilumatobacter sp.]|nr:TIGR03086 family metal-binding protein [Ilumatobacter sp.]MDG2040768.1 TIGR03086 family metal-binding protein [Ilumatobacter sp.]
MSGNLQSFTQAAYTLRNVAVRMPADAWDNDSCCDGWNAREVAGHASWVLRNIAASAGAGERPEKLPEAAIAGNDPTATICASVDTCLAALDRPGALQTVAQTPFGEMPIDNFIGTIWIDPLTHAWDIADAAGIETGIDAATAAAAHAHLKPIADMLRGAGAFGPAVNPVDGDALSRFVALTGRRSMQS